MLTLPSNLLAYIPGMSFASATTTAATIAAEPDRARQVRYEQVVSVYREYPSGVLPSVFGATLLVFIMWQQLPHTALLLWLGALYTLTLIRSYLYFRFMRVMPGIAEIEIWRKRFVAGAAAVGCAWGSTAFIMFTPDSLIFQWVMLTSLFAVCAGGVSVMGYYLPAFYAFAIPLVTPVIARQLMLDGTIHLVVALI
ncbi:MAG: hypothetical protein M3Q00_09380, partial [Pseudomonadota bacterium]|nr:hypothetical protein [Pseudomonadota bacterium]